MKKIVAIFLLMIIIFSIISNAVMAETGVITSTTVRLREEPNTTSDTLMLIGEDAEVEVLGEENGWYRVEYDGVTGYISSDYVSVEGESSSSNEGSSGTENTATAVPNNSVEELPDNTQVVENTTGSNENNNSGTDEVETPETPENTGSGDITTPTTNEETEFDLANNANLRTIPSFTSSVTGTISSGTRVTVLDSLNNWVKITDGTNSGWVIRQNV